MKPIAAQASVTAATVSAGVVRFVRMANVSNAQASRIKPPIVGVPCLDMWPAGPSSRIC